MTYLQAIAGLREEMRADERVFLMGEDIGFGGAFKVTDGFIDEVLRQRAGHGHAAGRVGDHRRACRSATRVRDAVRHFISCGFDQLVNVALTHYRFGLAVPITVRLPSGR